MPTETKPADQGQESEIQDADQLETYKDAEMTEEDKKIIKKRQKKNPTVSPEAIEYARQQEKNFPLAQKLIGELVSKLNNLGFVLAAKLDYRDDAIRPTFDLRPMTPNEVAQQKAQKEAIERMASNAASKAVDDMLEKQKEGQEPANASEEKAVENTEK